MEFKEVIGRRRSIRYFVPYWPAEREKIQTILEAARLASCAVNATFIFMEHTTVQVWLASLQRQTQLGLQACQEGLYILAAFCAYVGQSLDAIIATCLRDTPEGKIIHRRNRQHYTAQIDAFQRQVAGGLRQQVQYGRVVRSFLIHNGVMLQAGWQYSTQAEKG